LDVIKKNFSGLPGIPLEAAMGVASMIPVRGEGTGGELEAIL
jgi:hypothetical protein